jgi:hypothetical protein
MYKLYGMWESPVEIHMDFLAGAIRNKKNSDNRSKNAHVLFGSLRANERFPPIPYRLQNHPRTYRLSRPHDMCPRRILYRLVNAGQLGKNSFPLSKIPDHLFHDIENISSYLCEPGHIPVQTPRFISYYDPVSVWMFQRSLK